jgi:hypothetical protein
VPEPQEVNEAAQVGLHAPEPLQTSPAGQGALHAPQFALSERRVVQVPEQLVSPATQLTAQVLEAQVSPLGQALPQLPQCAASWVRFAQ